KFDLLVRERHPVRCGAGRCRPGRVGGGDANRLPLRDMIPRRRPRAVDAQLPGARPARHRGEADIGHVALEPAVEANTLVLGAHLELAHCVRIAACFHATALMNVSPSASAPTERPTDTTI